jgi:hypothetical protein
MTPGAIQNVMGTGSRKIWTYFTSDASAPDGNQPHNAVQSLGVGDSLKASISFTPTGVTSASTSREFRFGVFFDPTNARVQVDTNSDSGGGAAPWGDAVGYGVQLPLNATSSGTTPLQIGKRTSSANTGLISSSASYTFAPSGGTSYAITSGTNYTVELEFLVVSAAQLDVTARLLQGATLLSSHSASDTTTAFGGTANIAGSFPGAAALYTSFDQLFWRMSTNTQASQVDINNLFVEYVPEPGAAAASLLVLAGWSLRRRASRCRKGT